ncbi:hypothetical protein N431DRAFT_242838 [Stipitochalara longipes BDJ]|nr:hypothetical protein N431DRAFT_242838 [Stipitochalara longipes BDJ]
MARKKPTCFAATRTGRPSLHHVLSSGLSHTHIGLCLCSGDRPEDTYSPDCLDPHTRQYYRSSQQAPSSTTAPLRRSVPWRPPLQIPKTSTCAYLFCVPQSSLSYIILALLCGLPQGYHQERIQQHEVVVIPGNTRRKRGFGVAPERNDAGQWRSFNSTSSGAD